MRKRRTTKLILIVLMLFGIVGGVNAAAVLERDRCIIPAGEVIEGDLFLVCGELVIEGEIEGNLIGVARTAVIEGTVEGGVYLAGLELRYDGEVGGDIHYIGVSLQVESATDFAANGDILAASLSTHVAEGARIPGSVISLGYQLIIGGTVEREVNFWGSALEILGEVEQNVTATVGNDTTDGVSTQIERLLLPFSVDVTLIDPGLRLVEAATIGGDLNYTAPGMAALAGEVVGAVKHTDTSDPFPVVEPTAAGLTAYLSRVFDEFVTLGVLGVIGLLLIPRQMQMPIQPMQLRPISTFGVGMLSFILSFPIFLIFALISLIVIIVVMRFLPLDDIVLIGGIVLGLANIGSAALFYFAAIYISRVIFGLALGRFLLRIAGYDDRRMRGIFIGLGIGILLMSLGSAVPVIGWVFNALALFFGLGAILSVLRAQFRRFREAVSASSQPSAQEAVTVLPYFPDESRHFAPPVIDDRSRAPGTHNLPPGFDWWGESEDRDG